MALPAPDTKICKDGYIAELRKARKSFTCNHCHQEIKKGEQYYSVILGGGGLAWIKYPYRLHIDCLEAFL